MAWRKANNIDAMLTSYQEPEVMAKYWPGGICGRDKEGRPVQIDRFGAIDLKGYSSKLNVLFIAHVNKQVSLAGCCAAVVRADILKAMVYRSEKLKKLMKEESEQNKKQIDQVVQILDMDGFGRKHMWIPGLFERKQFERK